MCCVDGGRSRSLTVLCDLLDVAAARLDEGVEVPGDMVGAARFSVRHVGSSEPDPPARAEKAPVNQETKVLIQVQLNE